MNIFCYSHHINDWQRDTGHLSLEKKGAYREILDRMYLTNGRLKAEPKELCRIIGTQTPSERRAVKEIVEEFFEVHDGYLYQKRCFIELEKIRKISTQNSFAGKQKNKKNKEIRSAHAEQTQEREDSGNKSERTANQNSLSTIHESSASSGLPEPLPTPTNEASQADDAARLVRLFDQKLSEHYGASGERETPYPSDHLTASGWLAAGLSVDECIDIISGIICRQKARDKQPPRTLAYFEPSMRDALSRPRAYEPRPADKPTPLRNNIPPKIFEKLCGDRLDPAKITRWFGNAEFKDGGKIILVETPFIRDWIIREYESSLIRALGFVPEIVVAQKQKDTSGNPPAHSGQPGGPDGNAASYNGPPLSDENSQGTSR